MNEDAIGDEGLIFRLSLTAFLLVGAGLGMAVLGW
jgi:hypothetical protein